MSRSRWDTFGYRIATLLNAETEERAGVLLKHALRHFAHAARARHASVIFLGPNRLPLRCVDSSTDEGLSACNQLSFEPQDLEALPEEGFVEDGLSTTGDPLWVRTMPLPPSPYTALIFLHGPEDGDRESICTYSGLLVVFLKRYGSELPASPSLAEAMTQTMTELAQSLDREQILDRALSQLEQLVPHDAGDVMLRDGPVVRVARHQGYDQFASAHVARSLAIPLDLKLFQRMIRTHTPIVVGDTAHNPDWIQIEAMDWIRSYASTPIVIEDHVIGFINLYSRRPGFFAPYHTRNLQAFAHYISVAIQNAKLYERAQQRTEESAALNAKLRKREQHLRSLNTLTFALNRTGDPDEILQLGLDQALQATGMDQGAIYLSDPQTQTMVRQVQHRSQNSLPAPTTQHEAVQRALREKRLVIADVHAADVRAAGAGDGSDHPQSLIAAPLILGGAAIGVMVLSTPHSHPPRTGMTELLRAIVDQLAFAAQRGRQASQVRDQLSTAHTLYEISTAFLSQMNTGGVAFLLTRTLTDHIPQAMGAALYQEQEESGTWSRIRVYVPDPASPLKAQWREGKTWAGEDLFLSLCKQKREQLFLSQSRTEALPVLQTFQSEDRQPTMLYIPLVLPNRTVWGIVALMLKDDENALQGYSATLLRAIVQQGTAAITRATLYEESQTNESQMHAILESSRDGVILVGEHQEIRYVNGQALKLLHIPTSPATWVDQPLDAFHRALRAEAPDLHHWLEDIADPIDLQEGIEDDRSPPPPDFETLHGRILNLQRWPVHSDQGHILGSLYLIRDVTDQRELERMREDFLHMLVHDLRNPLSNIKNALRFIADPMMADMADELVDIAQTNADRILNLVNTILEIGKLEAQQIHLDREPVILGPLVEKTAQDLMLTQQPFDFEAVVPDDVPTVWADPAILVRILDNLLSNATKFAPDGGIVRVTTAHQDDEDAVRISIYNNGPHFGPEVENHLFQKFSTGDYESQGYGLGLAFCRLAVEAHGGEIDAANEPEGGVTFTFTLPVYRDQDLVQDVFLSNLDDFDLDG